MEHTIRSGTFIRLLAVFLGLSQSMGRAQAQTPSRSAKAITPDSRPLPMVSGKISLPDAVQFALRHSPVVRGSEEELRAAEARVRSARARQLPWVSLNGFLSGGSNSNIVSSPEGSSPPMIMGLARGYFADGNVSLMAPVYTGGRLEAMIRAAAADEKASRFDLEVQRQDVILMTRTAYRQAQARNELISVAQARLTDNQERLRDDKLKLAQGAIPLLTLTRDEAAEAASQQDLTDAQRDETVALIELKTVIGADPASQPVLTQSDAYSPSAAFLQVLAAEAPSTGRTPSPAQPSPAGAAPLDTAAPALLRLAVSRRPEIMAANERVRSAGDTVAEARGSYLPQVDLFAMGDVIDTQASRSFAGTTYGLAASVPLYNGGDRRAQIDSALAMERQAQAERTRIELKVAQEVQDALAELRAAEQNVSTADAAEAAASEAYRVEMQRYQAGRSILVELLDALAARTAADSSKVQALYRYNLSRDQLLRATGSL